MDTENIPLTIRYTYNKLVRDKIPEEIENQGKECKYEILDDEKYSKELDKKLLEENNNKIEVNCNFCNKTYKYNKSVNINHIHVYIKTFYRSFIILKFATRSSMNYNYEKPQSITKFILLCICIYILHSN